MDKQVDLFLLHCGTSTPLTAVTAYRVSKLSVNTYSKCTN